MTDSTSPSCLITGARGYLGTYLARALTASGTEVHGLVRPGPARPGARALHAEVCYHPAELADPGALAALLQDLGPRTVFHGAVLRPGPGIPDAEVLRTNLLGLHHLIEACAGAGVERLVIAGSATEYAAGDVPLDEQTPLEPSTLYGVSKAAATTLGLQAHRAGKLEVVALRYFYVHGLDEAPTRLVPAAIRAGISGEALPMTGPDLRRDFVFIDDAVAASSRALSLPGLGGQVFNIGSGRDHSNEEVVRLLGQIMGTEIPTLPGALPRRQTDRSCWIADIARARASLGWEPEVQLEEGLRRSLEWHLQRGLDR